MLEEYMIKTEYFIVNGDDLLGVVYEHEKLGRIIVLNHPVIDTSKNIYITSTGPVNESIKFDILEFILKTIPDKK